jgi:acyl-lipid omega-6 desaturase (Delta-12 desaturase)
MEGPNANRAKNNVKRVSPGRRWPAWHQELAAFRNSDSIQASWQLINTLVPYFMLWYLMTHLIQLGYPCALTLILALPAGAFLVRIFILFHDCVHGSFFRRQGVNTFFGYFLGVLVFTSFEDWRFAHLRHHVTYANLDARGFGDIWTMTLTEYENSPKKKRLQYRLYRNPIVMLGLGAMFTFFLANRLPTREVKRKQRISVLFTNLLILAMILVANRLIGWRTYLLIQLPVFWFAGAAGIWLFYVQHQFPGGYWARKGEWEPLRAAMEGSSFYKLPSLLRWFSSNIGYHHVHHLNPRIPNYHLKKCYDSVPALQTKAQLTILESFSCIQLNLWDENRQEMVSFPTNA